MTGCCFHSTTHPCRDNSTERRLEPPSLSFVPSDSARYETNEKHLSLFCSPSFPSPRSLLPPSYFTRPRASELGVSLSPLLAVSSFLVHAIARARLMSITVALVDGSLLSLPCPFSFIPRRIGLSKNGDPRYSTILDLHTVLVCVREIAAYPTHDPPPRFSYRGVARLVICSPEQKMFPMAAPCRLHRLFVTLCSHREGNRCHSKVRERVSIRTELFGYTL